MTDIPAALAFQITAAESKACTASQKQVKFS
jgi:hypothetical protein